MRSVSVRQERWLLREPFVISRGAMEAQDVVVVELRQGGVCGRGEASPSARFGETAQSVIAAIGQAAAAIESATGRADIAVVLPKGAARSAVDSAFWDLEAKLAGHPAWTAAGLSGVGPRESAFTISLDTPDAMATAAAAVVGFDLLKLKLGAPGDLERVRAVRAAVPDKRLIVDANEGWSFQDLKTLVAPLHALGVELIEQPLPENRDAALAGFKSPVPLCADEACTDRASLATIVGRYDFINVKLEKCGGLTEGLALIDEAVARGLRIMVGCRIGTSLGLAPVVLAAQRAEFADLDGPFLLASDRSPGLSLHAGRVGVPDPALWG
ncbi:MAG: N-acetyl-D-Glu racemase DgcA [Rhizomicrobium sp.]